MLTPLLFVPWNVTCSVTSSSGGFDCIVKTVNWNLPWLFPLILGFFYAFLLFVSRGSPGRKKYAYITFIGMLTSVILELFGLMSPYVTGGTAGLWILTVLIVVGGEG